VAAGISPRRSRIFLRDASGRRPVFGEAEKFQTDPHFRELIPFFESFHGDPGAGLGASHQPGGSSIARVEKCALTKTWVAAARGNPSGGGLYAVDGLRETSGSGDRFHRPGAHMSAIRSGSRILCARIASAADAACVRPASPAVSAPRRERDTAA